MGLYARFILPRLIDLAMRDREATRRRSEIIPKASGVVVEVGIGSGLNLPFYSSEVRHLYAIDPSAELLRLARPKAEGRPFTTEFLNRSAEQLPLPDGSVDTAVVTWALCSIPDPEQALREIRRVLKPTGRYLFIEHGLSADRNVRAWQNRINPIWSYFAGGCNLNRKIDELICSSGFALNELHTSYLGAPRPMTFTYEGLAVPA